MISTVSGNSQPTSQVSSRTVNTHHTKRTQIHICRLTALANQRQETGRYTQKHRDRRTKIQTHTKPIPAPYKQNEHQV